MTIINEQLELIFNEIERFIELASDFSSNRESAAKSMFYLNSALSLLVRYRKNGFIPQPDFNKYMSSISSVRNVIFCVMDRE